MNKKLCNMLCLYKAEIQALDLLSSAKYIRKSKKINYIQYNQKLKHGK